MPELYDYVVGGILSFSGFALAIASREYRQQADRIEDIDRVRPSPELFVRVAREEGQSIPYAALSGFVQPSAGETALRFSEGQCVAVKKIEKEHREEWGAATRTWYDVVKTVGEAFQMVSFSLSNSRICQEPYEQVTVKASQQDITSVLETVDNKYVPAESGITRGVLGLLAGNRVKGHEHITQVLAVGRVLTILGQVSYLNGRLEISAPSRSKDRFVITSLDVDALIQDYRSRSRILNVLAFLCAAGLAGYALMRVWKRILRSIEESRQNYAMQRFREEQAHRVAAGEDVPDGDVDAMCVICLAEPRNTTILECGHLCTCAGCAEQLEQCPVCRGPITRTVRTYT